MNKFLETIAVALTGTPHFMASDFAAVRGTDEYSAEWLTKGKPHVWLLDEEARLMTEDEPRFKVFIDVGHGNIALYDKQQDVVSTGKWMASLQDGNVVAFDKEYYSFPSCLYINVQYLEAVADSVLDNIVPDFDEFGEFEEEGPETDFGVN